MGEELSAEVTTTEKRPPTIREAVMSSIKPMSEVAIEGEEFYKFDSTEYPDWRLGLFERGRKSKFDGRNIEFWSRDINFTCLGNTSLDRLVYLQIMGNRSELANVIYTPDPINRYHEILSHDEWKSIPEDMSNEDRQKFLGGSEECYALFDSLYLVRQDGLCADLLEVVRKLRGDKPLSLAVLINNYSERRSWAALYDDKDNLVICDIPESEWGLFILAHELGHSFYPITKELVQQGVFAYNNILSGWLDKWGQDPSQANPLLVSLAKTERSAYVGAYWLLKTLAEEGFITFDDHRFFGNADDYLRFFIDQQSLGVKGRVTPDAFASNSGRQQERQRLAPHKSASLLKRIKFPRGKKT